MGRVGAEKPSRNAEFRVELVELDLILNFALAAAAALSVASFAGLRRVFEAVFRAPRKTTVVVRRAGKTSELEISGSRVDIEITSTPGGCELRLTHALPRAWADYAGRTQQGWATMLDALRALF